MEGFGVFFELGVHGTICAWPKLILENLPYYTMISKIRLTESHSENAEGKWLKWAPFLAATAFYVKTPLETTGEKRLFVTTITKQNII